MHGATQGANCPQSHFPAWGRQAGGPEQGAQCSRGRPQPEGPGKQQRCLRAPQDPTTPWV